MQGIAGALVPYLIRPTSLIRQAHKPMRRAVIYITRLLRIPLCICVTTIFGVINVATAESNDDRAGNSTGDTEYVGAAMCRLCHRVESEHWDNTTHAQVFKYQPRNSLEQKTCEACHGPGNRHVGDPTNVEAIIAFTREGKRDLETQNGMCLQCHEGGERFHWLGSVHEVSDVGCSDCHNPMTALSPTGLLREASVNQTCFKCHGEQRLQFKKRSHMPLLEGKMDCVDCHQPHGSTTDPLLQAASTFELCTECHADKRGPFLWEHAPVTEGCIGCHLPHGSNRDSLLVTSPPFLCQQCHAQIGVANHPIDLLTPSNLAGGQVAAARDVRLIGRGCVNCHAQIHGSNHPSGARFHR